MKRTGIDHPKTKRLAKLLGVAHFSAVGILECVWQFTARHAIRGDVGRWSDEEIADAIGWPTEDAGRLIAALVDAVWIERHSQHRLIVHDWKDHCDESTKKTIKNHGWEFVQAEPRVASRESFATVPETFRNDRESFSTVPDSQSLSQAVAVAKPQPSLLSSPDGENEKGLPAASSKDDSEKPSTKAGTSPKFSDEDAALAREMFDGIKAIQPNARPPNLDRWADEMRLLRSDGQDRTAEGIGATLAWVRQDQFWKSNILSPAKLRKHWDTLQLKRSSQNESRTTSNKTDGLYREAAQPGRRTF